MDFFYQYLFHLTNNPQCIVCLVIKHKNNTLLHWRSWNQKMCGCVEISSFINFLLQLTNQIQMITYSTGCLNTPLKCQKYFHIFKLFLQLLHKVHIKQTFLVQCGIVVTWVLLVWIVSAISCFSQKLHMKPFFVCHRW